MHALQRHQLRGVVDCARYFVERPRGDRVGSFGTLDEVIQEVDGRVCLERL